MTFAYFQMRSGVSVCFFIGPSQSFSVKHLLIETAELQMKVQEYHSFDQIRL